MVGIACRIVWERMRGEDDGAMEVFAAGVIAGDAIYSFVESVTRGAGWRLAIGWK